MHRLRPEVPDARSEEVSRLSIHRTHRSARLTIPRNHHNRKHNLRYTCVLCAAAFGLRKDLERHEFTVHKDHFRSEIRMFCPNMYCSTPQKEYNRKDNFNRHVKRCQQAIAKHGIVR
jgi:hypothetical protein